MASSAWKKNTALSEEANKRYATTESKLKNLKNTALLFGQQIGDDLNPTIRSLIDGAEELLQKFLSMDESQRKQIIQFAAYAAAAGPVLLVLGKITKGVDFSICHICWASGRHDGILKYEAHSWAYLLLQERQKWPAR